MKISLGVCAKNEEFSIIPMLNSLKESILSDSTNEYLGFICINGSTDKTLELVKYWITNNVELNFKLLEFPNGDLIESQRLIILEVKKINIENIIFLDADIILDKNCLKELSFSTLDSNMKAAYAISIPLKRPQQSFIEKSLNLYDTDKKMFSERKHLHGRTFLIRVDAWNIPKTRPKLIADDIYLSFYLLKNFGEKSIKKIPSAFIYFNQISSYKDFYNYSRRRNLEISKCLKLFPEFKTLPKNQIHRKFLWGKIFSEDINNIFIWLFFIFFRKINKVFLFTKFFLKIDKKNQWLITNTTKKAVVEKPLLILIEGLDCSGKKTLAKTLELGLKKRGISCITNIGPMRQSFYKKILKFISLNRFPNLIRTILYSFDGVGGKNWYKDFNSSVVIQISSPMRALAYSRINKKRFYLFIDFFTKKNIPKYDIIYYLTTSYKTRIHRHEHQFNTGLNSDLIKKRFFGEEKFTQMDVELKKILNLHQKITKQYNTDLFSSQKIAKEILNLLKEKGY